MEKCHDLTSSKITLEAKLRTDHSVGRDPFGAAITVQPRIEGGRAHGYGGQDGKRESVYMEGRAKRVC